MPQILRIWAWRLMLVAVVPLGFASGMKVGHSHTRCRLESGETMCALLESVFWLHSFGLNEACVLRRSRTVNTIEAGQ